MDLQLFITRLPAAAFFPVLSLGVLAAADAPPQTKYVCGVFLSNRFTYTQAVTLKKDGTYDSSTGASGRYRYDPAAKRVDFEGGALKDVFGRY